MANTNWNNPTTGSNYLTLPGESNARDLSILIGDFAGDTNVPEGALATIVGKRHIERFNSSTWDVVSHLPTYGGTVAGTANAITLAHSPALTAYEDGQVFIFTPSAANTGATTVNVDTLGAKACKLTDGSAFVGGELASGVPALFLYFDGAMYLMSAPVYPWTAWNPSAFTGFSANPVGVHLYKLDASKGVKIAIRHASPGTSNANTFKIALPFKSATIPTLEWSTCFGLVDNGVKQAGPGYAQILSASTTLDLYKDWNLTTWTDSNGKRVIGLEMFYQRA